MLNVPPTWAALALSGRQRSHIGFRSSTPSLWLQRWFRLMFLEIPVLVYVSGYARRQCQGRDVARCLESLNWLAGRRDQSLEHEGTRPGATQVLFKQEVHARVRKLVDERCDRASAIPLALAATRELLVSRSVWGPDGNAIWRTSPQSSWCLSLRHLLGALVFTMSCLKARATARRICRA